MFLFVVGREVVALLSDIVLFVTVCRVARMSALALVVFFSISFLASIVTTFVGLCFVDLGLKSEQSFSVCFTFFSSLEEEDVAIVRDVEPDFKSFFFLESDFCDACFTLEGDGVPLLFFLLLVAALSPPFWVGVNVLPERDLGVAASVAEGVVMCLGLLFVADD